MDKNTRKQLTSQAFKETLTNIIGNTAGIWLTFFILVIFFKGYDISPKWKAEFVFDGSLLIITFSFLTSIFIIAMRSYELNRYSICAGILSITTSVIYARHLGLSKIDDVDSNQWSVWLYLPFILSVILLFFAIRRDKISKNENNWIRKKKGKRLKEKSYSVFISYAIAGNKTPNQRKEVKKSVKLIEEKLITLGYSPVFNADNHNLNNEKYPPPAEAAELDFRAIENSKNFILFYPHQTPTSAILELGYALRDEDNILILTPNIQILPFLARGLNEISDKVRILEYEDADHIIDILERSHESYFVK